MTTTTRPSVSKIRALSPFHRIKAIFMVAAFISFVLSVSLWFFEYQLEAIFVGLWVPTIHSLGTLILTGERPEVSRRRS